MAITIDYYCKQNNKKGILLTDDQGFTEIAKLFETFSVVRSLEELLVLLSDCFGLNTAENVRDIFATNAYIKDLVFKSIDVQNDNSVTENTILSIDLTDETHSSVELRIVANEVIYVVKVLYDISANEVIDVSYKIVND